MTMSEFVQVKVTNKNYCAECQKDFKSQEVCYYTWYENDVFCQGCKEVMNQRVSEKHLDWELRIQK